MRVLWHRLDPCGYRMLLAMEKKQSQEIASVHDKASRLLQVARTGYQLVVKAAKAARRAHARLDGHMGLPTELLRCALKPVERGNMAI